jgi:hypothetical protein
MAEFRIEGGRARDFGRFEVDRVDPAPRKLVARGFAPENEAPKAVLLAAQSGRSSFEGDDEARRHRLELRRAAPASVNAVPNLKNMGGKVLTRPSISMIFMGAYWRTPQGTSERQHITGFARSYESNPVQGVLAQYGAGAARFAGGQVIDEISPRHIGRAALREIVMSQARAAGPNRDPQRIHTVVLPPGVILGDGTGTTSLDQMAGYHGSFIDGAGRPVYYAVSAYSGKLGRNGINFNGTPQDAITITLSHEWAEAVTDPDVEHNGTAWYDPKLGEIGDMALTQLPLGQVYRYVNGYAQQVLWSNKDQQYEVAPRGR